MLQKRNIIGSLVINAALMLFGMQVHGQYSNNYFDVSSAVKNVVLNSATALETEQVQTNAFTITVRSVNNGYNVYANIAFYSSSNGYVLPGNMLSIKLNTVTPSRTANFNEIPITGGNQLIIQSSRTGSSAVTYSYNLLIGPLGYDPPPGNYNAVVLFTMTQP